MAQTLSSVDSLPQGAVLLSGSGAYKVRSVIGSGGFGITYRATTSVRINNINAEAEVALKEFFIAAESDRRVLPDGGTTIVTSGPAKERVLAAKRDFIAEARRLQNLSGRNRNIVSVNEVFEANGTAYYVMEFLDGPSLRDYVASRGPLSQDEAMAIMVPLIQAVDFLHAHRIMHLDIKPANIVMASDGCGSVRPVLIDFGQSKHYGANGEVTNTVAVAGLSEGYAPVEQYGGIKSFSPPTDVYALAATMLYCLTGQKPSVAFELNPNTVRAMLRGRVSGTVENALVNALALQPSGRTQTARQFLDELGAEPQPLPPPPVPRKPKRRAALWVALGIVAICAIAVGLTLAFRKTPPPDVPRLPEIAEREQAEPSADARPAEETFRETAAEVSDGVASPTPTWRTYNFKGDFIDSKGKRWPVTLTAETNNQGEWGKCVYTNVTYGVVLEMQGSGSDDDYSFYSDQKGADLTIRIRNRNDGTWAGTASNGSKTLSVELVEG